MRAGGLDLIKTLGINQSVEALQPGDQLLTAEHSATGRDEVERGGVWVEGGSSRAVYPPLGNTGGGCLCAGLNGNDGARTCTG